MPPTHQQLLIAYREWLESEPCHTEVESIERHLARFWQWFTADGASEESAKAA